MKEKITEYQLKFYLQRYQEYEAKYKELREKYYESQISSSFWSVSDNLALDTARESLIAISELICDSLVDALAVAPVDTPAVAPEDAPADTPEDAPADTPVKCLHCRYFGDPDPFDPEHRQPLQCCFAPDEDCDDLPCLENVKMSKVEEYMHSRLEDFVDSYTRAVQALADATENYNRLLFSYDLPGSVNLEELALLEKRKEYLEREVRSSAIQLSDFVVKNEHDL